MWGQIVLRFFSKHSSSKFYVPWKWRSNQVVGNVAVEFSLRPCSSSIKDAHFSRKMHTFPGNKPSLMAIVGKPLSELFKSLLLYTYTKAQSKPKGNFPNQNYSDIDLWYILKMPLNYIWLSQLIGDIHFSATCLQWILAKSKQSR